jgi:GT2 family glycosyltransferase
MTETRHSEGPSPTEVAVVIPTFNSGAYLDQALASVAAQTALPSAVVVADDCSSDDTVERARRWQGRLPLEVVRLERNQGPGIARHRAIRVSSAPLLAMLDADDLLLPDHLETMVATYAACPGLISAQELAWYPGVGLTAPAGGRRVAKAPYQPRGRRVAKAPHQLGALLRHNFVNFGFFSRDLYESVGGFSDQNCEDWELWIRMVRAGATLTMASHPTAIHRVRPGSLSSDPEQTAQWGIVVLSKALRAARSPSEAAAARAGLRTLRAKLSFYRAKELGAQGHSSQARQAALGGLPAGGPRATAGLLALIVAPTTAARLERLTRPYRLPIGAHISQDRGSASGQATGANEPRRLAARLTSFPLEWAVR